MMENIVDEFEAPLSEKTELNPSTSGNKNCGNDALNLCDDDGSMGDESYVESNRSSDLNREWEKRRNEFHNIGYLDGLIAGKQESAQEGFNLGFKQSVLVGHKWGLVRGVTSALSCLPAGFKEKLLETPSNIEKLHYLHESAEAISTSDRGLKLFQDYITENETPNFNSSHFEKYFVGLKNLVSESPLIQVNLSMP